MNFLASVIFVGWQRCASLAFSRGRFRKVQDERADGDSIQVIEELANGIEFYLSASH